MVRLCELLGVTTVVDIGANEGQFGRDLRAMRFRGRLISFEPLGEPFARLARAAEGDSSWTAVRTAVSDVPGALTVHIAGNSVSSSVLPMLAAHSKADPRSSYVGEEVVAATTVDRLVAEHGLDPATSYLKVDVQGFESAVLDGAAGTLDRFAAVQLELSMVPLYDGQALIGEITDRMSARGFELWILMPEFSDRATGRSLQCDGVYVRRDLIGPRLRTS
ncbi:MAG: FkbM family methyltransferase [Nocardioides sp.]